MGSSKGQETIQGARVSETAVHDHGRRLNQREFRPMAEVPFRPVRQLSEYKGKGASASREFLVQLKRAKLPCKDLVLFYITCIRSILTYAVPVYHYARPMYLQRELGTCPRKSVINYLRVFRLQRGTRCSRYPYYCFI